MGNRCRWSFGSNCRWPNLGRMHFFLDWYNRPKLRIDYTGASANRVEIDHLVGAAWESLVYIRVRVRNDGRRIARSCRVFLTALHEVCADPDPTADESVILDSKVLSWEGWKFSSIDVPAGVDFYVDLMRVFKSHSGWDFGVETLFVGQERLEDYRGTYRFSLMISGDNAEPARCELNVEYNGDWHSLRAWQVRPS